MSEEKTTDIRDTILDEIFKYQKQWQSDPKTIILSPWALFEYINLELQNQRYVLKERDDCKFMGIPIVVAPINCDVMLSWPLYYAVHYGRKLQRELSK